MKLGSLFSGIGGLDLAVERAMGATTVWQVEYEPAPASILERHWPDAARYQDINDIDWSTVEPVDIICGGYPCQPFSHAGLRKGTNDPRHLWPRFADAIGVLRPQYAILENVAGHLSLGFDTVLADLASLGYDARWLTLRAADIGAPHGRKRLFVLATDTSGQRYGRGQDDRMVGRVAAAPENSRRSPSPTRKESCDRGATVAADAAQPGLQGPQDPAGEASARLDGNAQPGIGATADADGGRFQVGGEHDSESQRWQGDVLARHDADRLDTSFGPYAPAIERWEQVIGRPAPKPAIDGRLNPAFVEWMMGFDQGWTDGLTRTKALKALGNAVVPQQGEAAIRMLVS